ncbi:hypothetical protein [Bacillus toyonensis]|nr:hypothetical protein [Bacillus toyonensis]
METIRLDVEKLELIEKILLLEKETECEIVLQAIAEFKKEIDGK